MKTTSVVVFSALAAQSVSASWFDQKVKTIVQTTPQQCSPQELNGLDWSDLSAGPAHKSANYALQGFTCRESPLKNSIDKRGIVKRFPKNCITADIQVEKFTNEISSSKQFSITNLFVSVDKDVDVEFQYSMPDGSVCRQIQTCSSSGTKVINTQCGGATSVKSRIYKNSLSTVDKASLNIHKIDFNCGQQTGTASSDPANPKSDTPVNSTADALIKPKGTTPEDEEGDDESASSASPVKSGSPSGSSSSSERPIPTPSSKPASDSTDSSADETDSKADLKADPKDEPKDEKTEEKRDTDDSANDDAPSAVDDDSSTNQANAAPSSGSSSAPISASASMSTLASASSSMSAPSVSAPAAYQNNMAYSSSVSAPVYSTPVYSAPVNPAGPVVSVLSVITVTTTSCPNGNVPAPSTPAQAISCPNILPQCMQTYVKLTKCVNNADVNCLCPNSEFTKQVTGCIAAWGNTANNEIPQAIEYLQGLCAAYIPKNPYIVVDVPTYISLPPPTGPVTAVSISSAIVVPDTAGFTKSVVHIQSFVTKTVMTAVTIPAVKLVPSGPSDAVIVPATAVVPAVPSMYAPLAPGYGPRPYNTTNGRPLNGTLFNSTNIMPPPSLGAADSLTPIRCTVVLIAGLVSFALLL